MIHSTHKIYNWKVSVLEKIEVYEGATSIKKIEVYGVTKAFAVYSFSPVVGGHQQVVKP
jgi:hypothetical protein